MKIKEKGTKAEERDKRKRDQQQAKAIKKKIAFPIEECNLILEITRHKPERFT